MVQTQINHTSKRTQHRIQNKASHLNQKTKRIKNKLKTIIQKPLKTKPNAKIKHTSNNNKQISRNPTHKTRLQNNKKTSATQSNGIQNKTQTDLKK